MEIKKNPNIKIAPPKKPTELGNTPNTAGFKGGVRLTDVTRSKPVTTYELSSQKENKTIVKQEKINKPTSVPTSKKIKIIIATVAIVLVLSLLTTLVYFAYIEPSMPMNISINFSTEQSLTLENEPGSSTTFKKIMPGDNIDCSYIIKSATPDTQEGVAGDVYVRIRAYAVCDNNYYSNIFSFVFKDDNWFTANDGYFYCKSVLKPDTSIDAVKYLHINEDVDNMFAGKTIKVHFVAEALQVVREDNSSIESIWPTAPSEWAKSVK